MSHISHILDFFLFGALIVLVCHTAPEKYFSKSEYMKVFDETCNEVGWLRLGEFPAGDTLNILVRYEADTLVVSLQCAGDTIKSIWLSSYTYPDITYRIDDL